MVLLASCGGGGGGDSSSPATSTTIPPPGTSSPPTPVGPAWLGFGSDPQHSAVGAVATQALNRAVWSTAVDLAPQYNGGDLFAHYGSPVITAANTVVVPVKTGATGGFRVDARSGADGTLKWSFPSDYVPPAHNWMPSFNPVLSKSNFVFIPAAGGAVLQKSDPDTAVTTPSPPPINMLLFYSQAQGTQSIYNAAVFIDTPLTVDSQGNLFFGFIVTGATPANLVSGFARIGANGSSTWVGAAVASGDATIQKPAMNSAPALSTDERTLYVAVNTGTTSGASYLLALDSTTLATKSKAALTDPATNGPAWVTDNGTASPTVGPDGDVYFGVLESNFPNHNARGWLLHFDATLAQKKTPGSFGWDDTVSVVPASMVSSYHGASSYLILSKYNNYGGVGTGDGKNRVAVLDPGQTQADSIAGNTVMKEVLTILGPTADPDYPGGVKEWCINTAAVDPLTHSVLVNSEDGYLYRWDLNSNTFTQRFQLDSGVGEAYTPTAIGPDGKVYAVNNATLFAVGQ